MGEFLLLNFMKMAVYRVRKTEVVTEPSKGAS
jgi:hypothetical protein